MSSTHLEYALRLGRWPTECSYYGMHPHNQVLGVLNVPISKFEIFFEIDGLSKDACSVTFVCC
jgi:hypothetical protein